jgi:UDP-N-acetylglucosamine acyltransferase
MSQIHPTALISSEADIDPSTSIGPYSVISGKVKIGPNNKIASHVHIGSEFGRVTIGEGNSIFSGACVGGPPQDLSFKGEKTELIVGNRNTIREYATLNVGTAKGGGITRVGDDCLIMAYVHIAHDCMIGNRVIMANTIQLAGHVEIHDGARVGGMVAVAQFTRLGKFCYIGGSSAVNKDVPPYSIAQGNYAVARATNKIGLERAGFKPDEIQNINRALRLLIRGDGTVSDAVKKIEAECKPSENIQHLLKFITSSEHGIAR